MLSCWLCIELLRRGGGFCVALATTAARTHARTRTRCLGHAGTPPERVKEQKPL